jgi:hypothetical protein
MTYAALVIIGAIVGASFLARPLRDEIRADRRRRAQAWQAIDAELDRAAAITEEARKTDRAATLDLFGARRRERAERIAAIKRMMGERS